MKNTVSSEVDNQKKEPINIPVRKWLYQVLVALNKFRRSSFLSILMLIAMFLLVKGLDQAYTLLVDMVEDPISGSMALCYVIISVFALVISHYPIYTYYAKDINDSKDENYWYIHKLWFYRIYTFNRKPIHSTTTTKTYTQDYKAKYFRYALGIAIFSIWTYYIYKTYEPKLLYLYGSTEGIKIFNYVLYFLPYILLIIFLRWKQIIEEKNKLQKLKTYQKFYSWGVGSIYILLILSVTLLVWGVFFAEFDITSYYMLQILTLLLSLTYISFRLFRSKLYTYNAAPVIKFIEINYNYVQFFFIIALLLFGMLIYSNLAVAFGYPLPNAMAVLFAYFYIIYYVLACLLKYLFVIQAIKRQSDAFIKGSIDKNVYINYSGLQNTRNLMPLDEQAGFVKRGKNGTILIILGIVLFSVATCISPNSDWNESLVHQLDSKNVSVNEKVLKIDEYLGKLKGKIQNDRPILFVASHGGALKANIWTMKLLNYLQEETDGKFLDQTASFSGASGGMMGLAMYAVLSGQFPKGTNDRYEEIKNRINSVAEHNYASKDVSYLLGWDFIRKAALFRKASKYRDRSYYSMVDYQNLLEGKSNIANRRLTSQSFQKYWYDNIYKKNEYFPAILVNTAKTNGRRGVFSSVAYRKIDSASFSQEENEIFSNADNLSELLPIANNQRPAISFYQAVSSTNRFPVLSPAAKIKGYGHYIDAGAIDNSGLLTSLDWYDQLKNTDEAIIEPKTNVIFVEIINGKSNYIKYLLGKFKDTMHIDFIIFDEKEQGNLSAVLSAGANLDKNPDYFSDLVKRMEKRGRKPLAQIKFTDSAQYAKDTARNAKKYRIKYVPMYLPRVITLDDVEKFIGGEIKETKIVQTMNGKKIKIKAELEKFLNSNNNKIYMATEGGLDNTEWDTYEPTLARHISRSTLKYYDKILADPDSTTQIKEQLKILKEALESVKNP